ncbi:glycosyltransferase family 4 protein [Hydrogenophaga sp.]|uniref:glycosyltransferase family 4 protein n=1 Tax=Hydrogenophaga sp. TaxID=1904254 RepID=UPI00271F822C|nr:glycosyltransferase family 4 protein [Hydrogenophaga sp.]MDO9504992.1 glycosyltransferase family 4 protein [Hydrogenophaga sp.]
MERRIEAEVRVLIEMGHSVVVATSPFPGSKPWVKNILEIGALYLQWKPYKFIERGHFGWPFRWLAILGSERIAREKFDLAVICLPWNFIGMSMAYVLSYLRVPFVVAVHCQFGKAQLLPISEACLVKAMSCCVGGYGVSKPVTSRFLDLYRTFLPENCLVETIPNGVDVDHFKPEMQTRQDIRTRLGLRADSFVLIFCGRLDPMKRPCFAGEVFGQWAQKVPSSRLLVVGSGPEEASMREVLRAKGVLEKTVFIGSVSDTAPYYAASDCFLSTSSSEGFPLVVAEAASSGLPMLLPDDDLFRSIYGQCDSAQFACADEVDDWVQKLQLLFQQNSECRAQFAFVSREFAIGNLSLISMNKRLCLFYASVLSRLSQQAD